MKTFNAEQLQRLASEIERILKPGGVFSLIEVSDPRGWWLRHLYMFYLRRVMPIIEKVFLGYSYGFSMIGVYVGRFGDCSALKRDLEAYGLNVDFTRHYFGCATGLPGSKPKVPKIIERKPSPSRVPTVPAAGWRIEYDLAIFASDFLFFLLPKDGSSLDARMTIRRVTTAAHGSSGLPLCVPRVLIC